MVLHIFNPSIGEEEINKPLCSRLALSTRVSSWTVSAILNQNKRPTKKKERKKENLNVMLYNTIFLF